MIYLRVPKGSAAPPAGFYASPSGSATGAGTIGDPWTLGIVFSNAGFPTNTVQPGDTVWLRGGTYTGTHSSSIAGSAGNPITFKNYPGEHVVIDSASEDSSLSALRFTTSSGYLTWLATSSSGGGGIEIFNSATNRPATFETRATGVNAEGPEIKFINVVIHDNGQGVMCQPDGSQPQEYYGCLIYYNGNSGFDHGFYSQNVAGTKTFKDNIVAFNCGRGFHLFSHGQFGNRLYGNMAYSNGSLRAGEDGTQYLFIGATVEDFVMDQNYGYGANSFEECQVGNSNVVAPVTITDNYLAMCFSSYLITGLTMTGNEIYPVAGDVWYHAGSNDKSWYTTNYASNTYGSAEPGSGKKIVVRPNVYEAGRGHVYIFNWDLDASVDVDLSTILSVGADYEIRYALNYYGSAVASGTYGGGTVSIPVNSLTMATPVGLSTPSSVAPKISAFVVITV